MNGGYYLTIHRYQQFVIVIRNTLAKKEWIKSIRLNWPWHERSSNIFATFFCAQYFCCCCCSQSNEINNIQFVVMPSIVTCQLASIPACAHTNTATRVQCEVCLSHEPSVPVSIDRFVWFNRQILETENGQLFVHMRHMQLLLLMPCVIALPLESDVWFTACRLATTAVLFDGIGFGYYKLMPVVGARLR